MISVSRVKLSKIEESKFSMIEISRYIGIKDRYIEDRGIKSKFKISMTDISRYTGIKDRYIKDPGIKSKFKIFHD